jgi:hypothetical protein
MEETEGEFAVMHQLRIDRRLNAALNRGHRQGGFRASALL